MAAAGEQQQIGKLKVAIDQPRRQSMAFEMVDRDQRLVASDCQPLAREQSDHHPTDQAGAGGGGDGVNFADLDVSLGQHLADQPGEDINMGARGDFRNHPAERAMRLILTDHRLGKDLPVATDQRHRAIVTRRFETENERHVGRPFA